MGRPEPGAGPEDAEEEAVPGVPGAPCLQGTPSAERLRGSRDSWGAEEDPESGEPRDGRTSRTASLVSGLLTELYSCAEEEEAVGAGRGPGGRQRRRDSLDSSTEASGSDVFLGGRGSAGDSRVLQELQERPSQRHQRQYLRQKGERRGRGLRGLPGAPPAAPARAPALTWAHLAEPPGAQYVCGVSSDVLLVPAVLPILDQTWFLLPLDPHSLSSCPVEP